MIKDNIFVRITETLEEQNDLIKINFSTCNVERIYFYNTEASPSQFDKNYCDIIKAHPEVFQDTLFMSLPRHSKSNM